MKRLLVVSIFCLFAAVSLQAQDVCPAGKVCLDQQTANRLFNTVEQLIEAKDVINKMLAERGASDQALASANQVIEAWKQLDVINNTIIAKQRDVIAIYEKTLQLYASLVEKLQTQLNKPKSAWSKVGSALKTIGYILAGAALGRGL